MRILMLHGRTQGGRLADDLPSTWVDALKKGFVSAGEPWPASLECDFPYYGDLLDELAANANLPSIAEFAARGPGHHLEYADFLRSALEEIDERSPIPENEIRANLESSNQHAGPEDWRRLHAIARTIDYRLTRAATFTIEKFLGDAFLYLAQRDVARRINEIVEQKLTHEPTIVIGHSLGSVIAYRVLMRHRQTIELRKFITVGSPLGLRAISSRLGLPENPAAANGWYNASDERDLLALNPLDEAHFPTDPAIVNNTHVRNRTDNRHGVVGYLEDQDVARQVAAALS